MLSSSVAGGISPPPRAELREDRHQCDRLLSQAVDGLLLMGRVIGLCDHSLVQQHFQPVRQDVGRDAFFGLRQQLTEVPPSTEHHVP
jgi:hypothetical protein